MKKKLYHVTFLYNNENRIATGKKYEALDEIEALNLYKKEFPDSIFLYIASEEMFNYKY